MLFAQCVSFVLPQLLWQLFRHRARVDLHAVVHSAGNAAASLETETRNKHVVMAARMMERALARGLFGINCIRKNHVPILFGIKEKKLSTDFRAHNFLYTVYEM